MPAKKTKTKPVRADILEMEQTETPQPQIPNSEFEGSTPEGVFSQVDDAINANPVAVGGIPTPTLEQIMSQPDADQIPQEHPITPEIREQIERINEGEAQLQKSLIDTLRKRVRLRDNAAPSEVLQAVVDGRWSRRIVMLTPFNRPINPHAHFAILAHIRKNPALGYNYRYDTIIQRARNLLAMDFLNSEAEWSWWLDGDTIASFGDPGFFYHQIGARIPDRSLRHNTLPRLLSHQKTIVGAVYRQRKPDGNLVIQPDLHPRHQGDKDLVEKLKKEGPFDSLYQVGYVATGCALIHRSVYKSIQDKHPELAPKREGEPWDFFGHEINSTGEDIHFCRLAAECGHPSFLDTMVFCAHLGEMSYAP